MAHLDQAIQLASVSYIETLLIKISEEPNNISDHFVLEHKLALEKLMLHQLIDKRYIGEAKELLNEFNYRLVGVNIPKLMDQLRTDEAARRAYAE